MVNGLKNELTEAKGSIVNVTSIAGSRVHPFAGAPYATSKAALAALTREMAHDLGPLGIRVNAIAPGEVETSILSPGTDKIVDAASAVVATMNQKLQTTIAELNAVKEALERERGQRNKPT